MPAALTLDDISVVLIWTAVVLYALAFIAYVIDLGRRSAAAVDTKDAANPAARELVGAGGVSVTFGDAVAPTAVAPPGGGATAGRGRGSAGDGGGEASAAKPRYVMARIGTSLTVIAFLLHLAGTITR